MFDSIYFNGEEYRQMWLNGSLVWEKVDDGSIVYPYKDCDTYVTYYNNSSTMNPVLQVIDSSLPYSINGIATNTLTVSGTTVTAKLKNLKMCSLASTYSVFPLSIEQMRIPKQESLDSLFSFFTQLSGKSYSWQPQYFEFHPNPTNMSRMFSNCKYLTDDLMNEFIPYFPNTASVTDMSYMFYNCYTLANLDLNFFSTSNVNTMAYMFYSDKVLKTLNAKDWDVSKVTNMNYMFYNCYKLTSLDLSGWHTTSLTTFNNMFQNCDLLRTLDIRNFDTRNVTSTNYNFRGVHDCTIYIGANWTLDTSSTALGGTNLTFIKVKDYPYNDADTVITYRNASSSSVSKTFTIIDSTLPYSIDGVETTSKTFSASSETKVKLINLKPTTGTGTSFFPTNIEQMRIPNLTDLSYLFAFFGYNPDYTYSWQPQYFEFNENPTNMSNMFRYCQYITQSMWDEILAILPSTSSVTNMKSMFYYTSKDSSNPITLDLSGWDTSKVTDMSYLVYGSTYLGSLNVTGWNTSKVTNMYGTFCGCHFYNGISGVENWDVSKVTDMTYCFYGDTSLPSLDLTNWDTTNCTSMTSMFNSCSSLKELKINNFNINNATASISSMFSGISNCTVYISGSWKGSTSSTAYGGTNLTFIGGTVYGNIMITKSSVTVEEAYSTSFGVCLDQAPTNNQIVTLSINSSYTTLSTTSLTFTPSNYNTYQTVTVSAKKDGAYTNRTETITISSPNVSNKTVTVNVTNTETQNSYLIDFTKSTAPTLPSYMSLYGNGTYSFSHGTFTSGVYGLVPNNRGMNSTTAWTCYKYVAPKSGTLQFKYRCSSESRCDILTVHVNTSTSQPSYSSTTNRVLSTSGTTYASSDGTSTTTVTSGTTYYIHVQYCKDVSVNSGYDKGCIRKIELL